MENVWVDFKDIKARVSIEQVLAHYGIDWLKKKGDELRGRCPIHKGEGQGAFHVNVVKGVFHCFSCKKRGNVLDFVSAMEKCSVRDAGVKLSEWFSLSETAATNGSPAKAEGQESREETTGENKPLTFNLKGVDPGHPYLASRGLRKETAERFGVGFFPGKGSMAGRVVIPIHNERGELIAYAGRAIDSSDPRYKLPAGFHKSSVVYNLHRAVEDNQRGAVVVVEGFFDCLKVCQTGLPAVALMGCSMSEEQENLLASYFRAAWLLLDGDEAGRQAVVEISGRLVRRMFVKVVDVGTDREPDQLAEDELKALVVRGKA